MPSDKDKTKFEYNLRNNNIDTNQYDYLKCTSTPQKRFYNCRHRGTDCYIGGGPVVYLLDWFQHEEHDQVIIVEHRESYNRNEILMLQNNDKFDTLTYLDDVILLNHLQRGSVSPS